VAGGAAAPGPVLTGSRHEEFPGGGGEIGLTLTDPGTGLDVELTYRLEPSGVLAAGAALTRAAGAGPQPYDLARTTTLLPLPGRATELLDFTGKWSRERQPQRRPLGHGGHVREVRRGKPGLDSPYLLVAGVPGFGFRGGEVWAVHIAWSGDVRYLA
jgi:alpha-galactosidase